MKRTLAIRAAKFLGKEVGKEAAILAVTTVAGTVGNAILQRGDDEENTAERWASREDAERMLEEAASTSRDDYDAVWTQEQLESLTDDEYLSYIKEVLLYQLDDEPGISRLTPLGTKENTRDYFLERSFEDSEDVATAYLRIRRRNEHIVHGDSEAVVQSIENSIGLLDIDPDMVIAYVEPQVDWDEKVNYLSEHGIFINDGEYIRRDFADYDISPPESKD